MNLASHISHLNNTRKVISRTKILLLKLFLFIFSSTLPIILTLNFPHFLIQIKLYFFCIRIKSEYMRFYQNS